MSEEIKKRIPIWLYPSTIQRMDGWLTEDNCKSRSEFIEKALRFYMGYLGSEDNTAYLSKALVSVLQGTLNDSENRYASLMYKQILGTYMMMNVVAAGFKISEDELPKLEGKCIEKINRTKGRISFGDAVRFQKGIEE